MSAFGIAYLLPVCFAFAVMFRILRNRTAMPGAIKSQAELASLGWVLAAATREMAAYNPRPQQLTAAKIRLAAKYSYGTYLTTANVIFLAPFIDRWLLGELQHFLSQTDDFSDKALTGFKNRMITKGIWPTGSNEAAP